MVAWIAGLPIWQMIRTSGLVSYGLLTIGICLGILYSFPSWNGKTKAQLFKAHTFAVNGGTLLGLLHGVLTVIDQYAAFSWREVLIPFTAKQHPVLFGLGTIASYGLLIVIFTSDIRGKLKKRMWKMLHLLSYPIFLMSFVHGFFGGTDSGHWGTGLLYAGSMFAVVAVTVLRFMVVPYAGEKRGRVTIVNR